MHCKRKAYVPYPQRTASAKVPSIYNDSRVTILRNDILNSKPKFDYKSQCLDQFSAGDPPKGLKITTRNAMATSQKYPVHKNKCAKIIPNRLSVPIQTELYLEELMDKVEEKDCDVQTDEFLDRPPTPLFIPAATGVHVGTQIEPNELFDFDLEVPMIMEVLVGKTVEQALIEVQEEEELANLRNQKEIYREIHNADLMEVARLEQRNQRYLEEKNRRIEQQKNAEKLAIEMANKVSAMTFSQAYLGSLLTNTYQKLLERGYLYDYDEHDIEVNFMDPLVDDVLDSMDKETLSRQLLDCMIKEAVDQRHHEFRELARKIFEDDCLEHILPELRAEVTSWIIERTTKLAINRLELVSNCTTLIKQEQTKETIDEVIEELATEIIAQEEAELAAEDESHDSF